MAESNSKNELTLVGTIIHIDEDDIQEFESGSEKLTIKIEQKSGNYTNIFECDFWNDRIDDALNFEVGQEVRIRASLSGRLWQGKDTSKDPIIFYSITCWSIKEEEAKRSGRRKRRKGKDESEEESSSAGTSNDFDDGEGFDDEPPEEKKSTRKKKSTKKDEKTNADDEMPF